MNKTIYSPHVMLEDVNGIHLVDSQSILLKKRLIFLEDEITSAVVNETIRHMMIMAFESNEPITLIIDSPGGDIKAGFQLIDYMDSCPVTIKTCVLGLAASMGAVISSAGTKGYRVASKRSKIMIHQPLIQQGIGGNCSEIQILANNLEERRKTINAMLCEYTGQSADVMDEATSYDHYFNATEAKEFGLIDYVVNEDNLYEYIKGV